MSDSYVHQIDPQVARYLADIAEALNGIKACKTEYGEFYVEEVLIAFDGETCEYRVLPNDHGTYDAGVVIRR